MDAKLQTILLKIRKGATASINASAIVATMAAIGWKMETILNLRRVKPYSYSGSKSLDKASKERLTHWPSSETEMKSWFEAHNSQVIDGITIEGELVIPPAGLKLKKGATFFSNVKPVGGDFEDRFMLRGFDWVVDKATRITAPNGDQMDLYSRSSEFFRWAGERGLVAAVSAVLGMDTPEVEAEKKEANRRAQHRLANRCGECSVCCDDFQRNIRNKIWNHGFTRPGDGYLYGRCPGEGYDPYEISADGCVAYKALLEVELVKAKATLAFFQSDKVKTLLIDVGTRRQPKIEEITPEDHRWKDELKLRILQAQSKVDQIEREIARMIKRIADWKPVPLA